MSKQKKNSRRHSRIRFPFPALNIGNIIFGALFFYMAVSLFLLPDRRSYQIFFRLCRELYPGMIPIPHSPCGQRACSFPPAADMFSSIPQMHRKSAAEALFMGFPQQKMPIPLVFRQMRQRERRFVPRSHVFF